MQLSPQHNSKNSIDGPMQFARPSASDEPDPWVLVSGAAGNLPGAETRGSHNSQPHQQHQRRRSSSGEDFSLTKPRPLVESRPESYSVLPPGASPPVPGNMSTSSVPGPLELNNASLPLPNDREKDNKAPRRRNGHTHNPARLLRSLEPRDSPQPHSPPLLPPSNNIQNREEPVKAEREVDKRKASTHPEKKERTRDRVKERPEEDTFADVSLRSMIGWWSASSSENWSLALHICEAVSQNETNAKEAAKALRKTLKWGDPGPQLSAARLWAIMLRNPSPYFIAEATSTKFLSAIEEVITKPTTTPVVKTRVLDVLMGAAHAYPGPTHGNGPLGTFGRDKGGGYSALWRKVKPPGYPDEGIPFDTSDPMFIPPDPNIQTNLSNGRAHPKPARSPSPTDSNQPHPLSTNFQQLPRPTPKQHRSHHSHGDSVQRIIPIDEDVRRLFEECDIAKGNSQLLNQALTYARPEDLTQNSVIREYHDKCQSSQALLASQIDWATSQAKRLRELQELPPDSMPDPPHPHAEQLLEAILGANHELAEALRIYDDLQRVGEEAMLEREVEERSRRDIRLDRSQIQYIAPDGSLQMQPPGGAGGASGPSRTPSPGLGANPYSGANSTGSQPSLNSLPPTSSYSHSAHNSQYHLNLPPLARPVPHGPRKPNARSRSPSPDRAMELNHFHTRSTNTLDTDRISRQTEDDSSDDPDIPFQPTAKAMGKRRMEGTNLDRCDSDDPYKVEELRSRSPSLSGSDDGRARPHWKNQPQVYAYDAMAERTKAMEGEMRQLLISGGRG